MSCNRSGRAGGPNRSSKPVRRIALLLLVVAGLGFSGIIRHSLIEAYLLGVGVMTLVIAVVLLGWPAAVTRRL